MPKITQEHGGIWVWAAGSGTARIQEQSALGTLQGPHNSLDLQDLREISC